jgi:hypothetical protein
LSHIRDLVYELISEIWDDDFSYDLVWSHTILLQHLIRSDKNLWLILMSNFLTWIASLLFQTQYRVDEVIMITHERAGADKISAPWWDPTSKVYRSITIRDEILMDLCSILIKDCSFMDFFLYSWLRNF